MTAPLVFLNMIVKNESRVMERCLNSVEELVDGVIVADTGSSDDTREIIEEWIKTKNKKGMVFRHKWENFGKNRTRSLKEAQAWLKEKEYDLSNIFFLFIDADMCFPANKKIKKKLNEADIWDVRQETGTMVYSNLRLARASLDICVECPTHEYYNILTKDYTRKNLEEVSIIDIGDGGAKSDKIERDIRLLKEGLKEDPDNIRYWFYLANTLRDARDYKESLKAYDERIKRKGWYEELYCAQLYKGDCLLLMGEKEKAICSWMEAFNTDPFRLEALCRIAKEYRIDAKHTIAMLFIQKGMDVLDILQKEKKERILFVEKPAHDYLLIYELSICAYYVGMKDIGKFACEQLLKNPRLPQDLKESVRSNLVFYN